MSFNQDWFDHFRKSGAIWQKEEGNVHASYETATRHANFYFNSDIVVGDPVLSGEIARTFAAACKEKNIIADWVVSYLANVASGLIIAAKIAELLPARFGYVDLKRSLCCFQPLPGETVLLVVDDIHSGSSLKKTIALVEQAGGKIVPIILTMGNFSGKDSYEGIEISSIFTHHFESWPVDECLLCKEGSRAIAARQNWRQLIEGKPL